MWYRHKIQKATLFTSNGSTLIENPRIFRAFATSGGLLGCGKPRILRSFMNPGCQNPHILRGVLRLVS